jgi:perosamine synthetase
MDASYMAGPWISAHEIKVVEDCMRNGWENYYYVETFQKEFAKYHNRKFGIMTPNCTTSIHLLLTALGIKDGDEVIVPECTWIASIAPAIYLRAKPVFCDIDPINWCLDPVSLKRSITPRTKAIIVVDLFGNMPHMDEIVEIAKTHGIPLIEDAAEALGSTYNGIKAGKFGIGSVFSFHRTKTIATGEGGMLLLDDEELFKKCMSLRDHGRGPNTKPYLNDAVTYKYMPFNLQAAVGYAQFQRVEELINKKRWMYEKYKQFLHEVPDLQFNPEPLNGINGVWITAIVFGKSHNITKPEAIEKLNKLNLPARPFFYPLSCIPSFKGMEEIYRPKNPIAYDISSRGINLPCAFKLEEKDILEYCNGIKKILN